MTPEGGALRTSRLNVLRAMLDSLPEKPNERPPFESLGRRAPALRHEAAISRVCDALNCIVGAPGVAVVLVEFGGEILFANRCATCILGFDHAGGLMGKRLEDVVDADDLKILRTLVARVAYSGSSALLNEAVPLRVYRGDGEPICIRARLTVETTIPGSVIVGAVFEEAAPCAGKQGGCNE